MSTHDADKIRKSNDTIRLIFHKRNDSLTLKKFLLAGPTHDQITY